MWRPATRRWVTNPASGSTRLDFALPKPGVVTLGIYGVAGQRVRLLLDGALPAGPHAAEWDGRDARGRRAPAGVYFAVLEAGGAVRSRRLVRIR